MTEEPGSGGGPAGAVARVVAVLHRVEDAMLVLLLGAMVLLAPLQILLRNVFDSALIWGDPLLRVLVLWLGLFGAMAASRGDRHITVDVVARLLPAAGSRALRVVTSAFTAAVCGVVAWHSWLFVQTEREWGSTAFNDIPAWLFELVIPLSFAVIGLRYALLMGNEALALLSGRASRRGGRELRS